MTLSHTQQDYIKTIWRIEKKDQFAKMKLIAEQVGVKPPTVSAMIRQLENMALITYTKKTGASLTKDGKREAERIIRNHRLIETFLKKVLNLEEPLLHSEAEKLEHVISDHVIARIDEYLGYPSTDPHGSVIPIPGEMPVTCPMDDIGIDSEFRIVRLPKPEKEKKFCQKNGFVPGSFWKIQQVSPDHESYLVSNGKDYLALSALLARTTMVEAIKSK